MNRYLLFWRPHGDSSVTPLLSWLPPRAHWYQGTAFQRPRIGPLAIEVAAQAATRHDLQSTNFPKVRYRRKPASRSCGVRYPRPVARAIRLHAPKRTSLCLWEYWQRKYSSGDCVGVLASELTRGRALRAASVQEDAVHESAQEILAFVPSVPGDWRGWMSASCQRYRVAAGTTAWGSGVFEVPARPPLRATQPRGHDADTIQDGKRERLSG
jgi:hypothetical protein